MLTGRQTLLRSGCFSMKIRAPSAGGLLRGMFVMEWSYFLNPAVKEYVFFRDYFYSQIIYR